jgi:HK97 gp10 family phage protein
MARNDIKLKIQGQKELAEIGRNAAKLDMKTPLSKAIGKASFLLERRSKKLTPVDTGFLRSSIRVETLQSGLTAKVGPNTDYAVYVHEGTRFMRARPFMRQAVMDSDNELQKILDGTGVKIGEIILFGNK